MLSRPAVLGALLLASAASGAGAEIRTFVIANSPDGYGVDQCLAEGASCGKAVAAAYCRSREFDEAVSFRRVAGGEVVTASAGNAPVISMPRDAFVAIACSR